MTIVDILKYLYRKPQHILIRLLSSRAKSIDLTPMNRVVVVSPHPDDEVFGCSMLMNSLIKSGKEVHLIMLSKGEYIANGNKMSADEVINKRKELTKQAAVIIGICSKNIHTFSFPDNYFSKVSGEEVEKVREIINQIHPDAIFYPHSMDGSPDHEVASQILNNMTFDFKISRYYYCVWLWHHTPMFKTLLLDYKNAYVLKGDHKKKLDAIDTYVNAKDNNGFYYSGNLPKMFLKAVSWEKELFFEIK